MGAYTKRFTIDCCPHCTQAHAVFIEIIMRPEDGLRETVRNVLVQCICKSTGEVLAVQVEAKIPENYKFARARPVSMANGN